MSGTADNHGGGNSRDASGRFNRSLEGVERDAQAARLRGRGLTLRQIADALGYAGPSGVHKAIARALAAVPVEAVDELRRMQFEQLEYLYSVAMGVLHAEHHLYTQAGALVRDPDGDPVPDHMPVLKAIDRALRIHERVARLMGLDMPIRHELDLAAIDAEIARLEAEYGDEEDDDPEGAQADDSDPD